MKVLVNASTLLVGGGVQKAVQFVRSYAAWGEGHEWRALVSPQVSAGLGELPGKVMGTVETIAVSPARLLAGRTSRRRLAQVEAEFAPDVVFSVFGPVYHRFAAPHLMGFAIGWLTHPSALAWRVFPSAKSNLVFRLRLAYYKWWARRAEAWLLETQVSADGMVRRFGIRPDQVHVVPNGCADFYVDAAENGAAPHPALADRPTDEQRLLVFTSYKPHKNVDVIPEVAAELRRRDPATRVRFVFTLKDAPPWRRLLAEAAALGADDMLINVGPVPAHAGPQLYASCTALFMPTLLETFSANYPEAMCMERPIITSDLDFARDICGDAAAYFDPLDPRAAADAIVSVLDDPARRAALIEAGRRRLPAFGTGEERFRATLAAIEAVAARPGGRP